MRTALTIFSDTEAYVTALAAGGLRYDLDGSAKGEVSNDEQASAAQALRRTLAAIKA